MRHSRQSCLAELPDREDRQRPWIKSDLGALLFSDDVAGFGLAIEMQLDPTSLKLLQHILDASFDGRIVRAIPSDEFLDNGAERRWRQLRVWDTHPISLLHNSIGDTQAKEHPTLALAPSRVSGFAIIAPPEST